MRALRLVTYGHAPTLTGSLRRGLGTQAHAARQLGLSKRTIEGRELEGLGGGKLHEAYAYVGLAYRLGGEERAQAALEVLAQLEAIEGAAVAVRRGRRARR